MTVLYMAIDVGDKRCKFAFFLISETTRPFRVKLPELWPCLSKEVADHTVEQTPGLDDLQRDFYKATLDIRRRYVLELACRVALEEVETSTVTVKSNTLATDIVPEVPSPGLGGNPGLLYQGLRMTHSPGRSSSSLSVVPESFDDGIRMVG